MIEKTLKDILSKNIISVSPDTLLSNTISIMRSKKISCILITKGKKPLGIFTERDVLRVLHKNAHQKNCKISEVMTKPVLTASIDMNIYQAYNLVEQKKICHLAVEDSQGKIVGIVTSTDFVNSFGAEYFIEVKDISKIMTKNVISIEKENLVQEAIDKMFQFSISCIVVEENKFPVGILTERDVTRLFQQEENFRDLKIKEVMSQPIISTSLDTPVYEAVNIMNNEKIRRLVVVDNEGKIAGLITQYDIAKKIGSDYIVYLKDIIIKKELMLEETKKILSEKLVQEEIKHQKLEALGILAGGIAHDFNNILTAILGNTTLAKLLTNPDDERFSILTEVEKSIKKAQHIANQLFAFSKGGSAPVKKIISILKLLKETVEFALRGSNVIPQFFISDDLCPIEGDEGQITQVIHNLIINAKESMPEGGRVEISAQNIYVNRDENLPLLKGNYIKISIKDYGHGIAKKYLPKIFDPFLTTKSEGRGLGLAIAYSIISNHKGYIYVESKLGIGTTFYVYLPASKKKIEIEDEELDKISKGKGKILIMDDVEDILTVTSDILKHLGYKVEVANDGMEAIKKYKKAKDSNYPFDVVILDLIVPGGMSGRETIKELLSIDREVKAIASSGYSNDPIMANFKKYGFRGVMAKPFDVKEISRILHELIKEGESKDREIKGRG